LTNQNFWGYAFTPATLAPIPLFLHHKENAQRQQQERNKVRWRPGQEASLASPGSNLTSFGSKFWGITPPFPLGWLGCGITPPFPPPYAPGQQSQKVQFVGALMLLFTQYTMKPRDLPLSIVIVALPTKYVCFQQSHEAKRLLA